MAVIACFLICWTPYHVQRMMFVILTRTNSWKSHPNLLKIQETLHLVSGKKLIYSLILSKSSNQNIHISILFQCFCKWNLKYRVSWKSFLLNSCVDSEVPNVFGFPITQFLRLFIVRYLKFTEKHTLY